LPKRKAGEEGGAGHAKAAGREGDQVEVEIEPAAGSSMTTRRSERRRKRVSYEEIEGVEVDMVVEPKIPKKKKKPEGPPEVMCLF